MFGTLHQHFRALATTYTTTLFSFLLCVHFHIFISMLFPLSLFLVFLLGNYEKGTAHQFSVYNSVMISCNTRAKEKGRKRVRASQRKHKLSLSASRTILLSFNISFSFFLGAATTMAVLQTNRQHRTCKGTPVLFFLSVAVQMSANGDSVSRWQSWPLSLVAVAVAVTFFHYSHWHPPEHLPCS
mgnify:CR=1 FL=1